VSRRAPRLAPLHLRVRAARLERAADRNPGAALELDRMLDAYNEEGAIEDDRPEPPIEDFDYADDDQN
jgi:hypothetical protein